MFYIYTVIMQLCKLDQYCCRYNVRESDYVRFCKQNRNEGLLALGGNVALYQTLGVP